MFALRVDGLFGVMIEVQQKSDLYGLLIGRKIGGMEVRGFSGLSEVLVIGAGLINQNLW